ncbi:MAG: DUF998 domain-containing protein [Thermoplasmatales archaeon]
MKQISAASIFGLLGILSAWLTIALSWHLNPWFSIEKNALSDLGGGNISANGHPMPSLPIIYNGGLILTSAILIAFATLMFSISRNKMEGAGSSFFIIAGVFLALIGIYHEGTYPHDFVSIWFFILASLAYLVISIGIIRYGRFKIGLSMFLIIILSWVIYSLVPWGSVAEGEVFGIAMVDSLVLMHMFSFR